MSLSYRVVRAPDRGLLREAARLHEEALGDRSFLTEFGEEFLAGLYDTILARRMGFIVAATDEDRLLGFILACDDAGRLLSPVIRDTRRFAVPAARAVIRHPRLIAAAAETIFFSGLRHRAVAAELLVIAVQRDHQSRGIGRQLVEELRAEFARRGIDRYQVAAHEDMKEADRFYAANGLQLARTYRRYGVSWHLYVDTLGR